MISTERQTWPTRCMRRTWTATAIWMCSPHPRGRQDRLVREHRRSGQFRTAADDHHGSSPCHVRLRGGSGWRRRSGCRHRSGIQGRLVRKPACPTRAMPTATAGLTRADFVQVFQARRVRRRHRRQLHLGRRRLERRRRLRLQSDLVMAFQTGLYEVKSQAERQ